MSGANDYELRIDVARLLREMREAAKLTQAELASRLGVHQSFISKYEAGERKLDVIDLRAVCKGIGTSLPLLIARLEKRWGERI